jgi:hypothetical protein
MVHLPSATIKHGLESYYYYYYYCCDDDDDDIMCAGVFLYICAHTAERGETKQEGIPHYFILLPTAIAPKRVVAQQPTTQPQ